MLRYFTVFILASFAAQALAARISVRGVATVSDTDKAAILAKHNEFRANVSPGAKNMMKMYWQDDLARVAESWAEGCPNGHDTGPDRTAAVNLSNGVSVGQNMAWRQANWDECITDWHSEVADFTYGTGSTSGKVVGHYVQLVWEKSNAIGCAFNPNCVYDPSEDYSGPTYVCNYAHSLITKQKPNPYVESTTSCVDCSGHCDSKLCDCGNKVCGERGVLNLGTCNCDCQPGWIGDTCVTDDRACEDTLSWCALATPKEYYCNPENRVTNFLEGCRKFCGHC